MNKNFFSHFVLALLPMMLMGCGNDQEQVSNKQGNGSDTFVFDVDAARTQTPPKERQRVASTPRYPDKDSPAD